MIQRAVNVGNNREMCEICTAQKVSEFGFILVHILPHSVWMRENADQNNSEYGRFLRSTVQSW